MINNTLFLPPSQESFSPSFFMKPDGEAMRLGVRQNDFVFMKTNKVSIAPKMRWLMLFVLYNRYYFYRKAKLPKNFFCRIKLRLSAVNNNNLRKRPLAMPEPPRKNLF